MASVRSSVRNTAAVMRFPCGHTEPDTGRQAGPDGRGAGGLDLLPGVQCHRPGPGAGRRPPAACREKPDSTRILTLTHPDHAEWLGRCPGATNYPGSGDCSR